jgi:hypothetical protein
MQFVDTCDNDKWCDNCKFGKCHVTRVGERMKIPGNGIEISSGLDEGILCKKHGYLLNGDDSCTDQKPKK